MRFVITLPPSRIQKPVCDLLKDAGVELNFGRDGKSLSPKLEAGPAEFDFIVLRPNDVGRLFERNQIHAAFMGSDMIEECGMGNYTTKLCDTGLSSVRMTIASRPLMRENVISAIQERRKLTIATKYPGIVSNWGKNLGHHELDIMPVHGSVEVFANRFSECIADLVDSGDTLRANGLVEVQEIRQSSTCLYVHRNVADNSQLTHFADRLESVLRARKRKMLEINASTDRAEAVIASLKPFALESVTRTQATGGMMTVKIACEITKLYAAIEAATAAGGTGDVVQSISMLGKAG